MSGRQHPPLADVGKAQELGGSEYALIPKGLANRYGVGEGAKIHVTDSDGDGDIELTVIDPVVEEEEDEDEAGSEEQGAENDG